MTHRVPEEEPITERQWIQSHKLAGVPVACQTCLNPEARTGPTAHKARWFLMAEEDRAPGYAVGVCKPHAVELLAEFRRRGEHWKLVPAYIYLGRIAARKEVLGR